MAWFYGRNNDLFLTLIGVIFCFFVAPRLYQALKRRKLASKSKCQSPPSLPQWDTFFGLDIICKQYFQSRKIYNRNHSLHDLFKIHGNTFQTHLYGGTQMFTVAPENIQSIYSTDFDSFGVAPIRGFVFGPFLGYGMMTEDGPTWKRGRAISMPTFTRPQLADMAGFDMHVTRMLDKIPKNGSTVDLQPLFNGLALDSTAEMLFGESVNSLARGPSSEGQTFLEAFNYAQKGVGNRMMKPFWNIFTLDKKWWQSCHLCHKFVDRVVDRAIRDIDSENLIEEKNHKYVLARELAKRTNDRKDIRDQLLNIFLPAHDAIAIPLTNIFFHLARHPKTYAKLRQDILSLPESANIDQRVLKKLPLLQRIINETFRLNPGVTTNERVALRDTILPTGGGASCTSPIFVRKDDLITLSFYTLQRRKDLWGADADQWNPERWEGEGIEKPAWTNLPFGGGPRICPGQELGLMQIAFVMVRLVREIVSIERRDPIVAFEDLNRVVTVSKNGCQVACYAE